jgi:sulfane dehydrogenase subunit SoxC
VTDIPPPAIRLSSSPEITPDELALSARNHGMPLEALRYPLTPLGLHYLLTHYDIPDVDPATWTLEVAGRVERPLRLTLADLRARPSKRLAVTMECAGNGRARLLPRALSQPWLLEAVGTAEWTGVPLRDVLEEAGVAGDAVEVVFAGLDRGLEEDGVERFYERSLPVDEARSDDVLLAYEVAGVPLPPQHGFPLRLVVPGWYGMGNVKWLTRITAVTEPFTGYQQTMTYRLRQAPDETGVPVTRMEPRALVIPPGLPDFFTRRRFVPLGPCPLLGRAWSGFGVIEAVEVSTDGGVTWEETKLGDDQPSPYAWRSWTFLWEPPAPGDYELCCRARDGAGHVQPQDGPWNLQGFANNAVQRVPVTVTPP